MPDISLDILAFHLLKHFIFIFLNSIYSMVGMDCIHSMHSIHTIHTNLKYLKRQITQCHTYDTIEVFKEATSATIIS